MEFNEHTDILFNKKITRHKMRKVKNKIGINKVNKILLSCFDNKRFVLHYGVHTLAYFHKDCKNQKDVLKDSHIWSWTRKDSHRRSWIKRDSPR